MVYGQVLHQQGAEDELINLNVGGIRHRVERHLLLRFPETRVGRLMRCCSHASILELCDDYSPAEREFYFDRSPQVFHCVLNFYRTGHFHALDQVCVFCFGQEMEYWGFCELDLEACCLDWFYERKDDKEGSAYSASPQKVEQWRSESSACSGVRRLMWQTLEDPGHSAFSRGVAMISVLVILTSVGAMCLHSMPEFKVSESRRLLASLENFCVVFFSVEFALRAVAAPHLGRFLGKPLNVIDVACVLPFYVTLLFEGLDEESAEEKPGLVNVGKVVQVLRIMRTFRVLKLARHSEGLRAFGETLKHCHTEVGLLVLFITVGISFFSTFAYYAEMEEASSKLSVSIPDCWWWAMISMTTVGYGDVCPQTAAGRVVAALCILCGILVVSLPITIIMNNFSTYFDSRKLKGAC